MGLFTILLARRKHRYGFLVIIYEQTFYRFFQNAGIGFFVDFKNVLLTNLFFSKKIRKKSKVFATSRILLKNVLVSRYTEYFENFETGQNFF